MAMRGAITLGNKLIEENVTSHSRHAVYFYFPEEWTERDALKKT